LYCPQFSENQLHAAIVELIVLKTQKLNIQRCKIGIVETNKELVEFTILLRNGLCIGKNSNISWTQVETGSSITWKYPSCVLVGKESSGEFYSVVLTNNYQQADTGTK
jgi:Fe-S cluster assembly protein SufB